MRKQVLRCFGLLFLIILCSFSVSADQINVTITESSTLTTLLSGNYSLLTTGTLSISNPSTTDSIYEFKLSAALDPFISIGKTSTADDFDVSSTRVKGYLIDPNETLVLPYTIFGVVTYDIFNATPDSMFEYYLNASNYEFSPRPLISLEKVERENESLAISPRFVHAEVTNPTSFDFFVQSLKVYKSTAADPQFNSSNILQTYSNFSVDPLSFTEFEIYDNASLNNSVYFLSSDVIVNYSVSSSITRSTAVETVSSGGGGGSGGGAGGGAGIPVDYSFVLKKTTNASNIKDGESFTLTVTITNNNGFSISGIEFEDEILLDLYDLVDFTSGGILGSDGILRYTINDLGAYDTTSISYTLTPKTNISGAIEIPAAEIEYRGEEFLSNSITLLHDVLADKKIFIEKEIIPIDDTFSQVKITLRNLGDIPVEDLLVTDLIGEDVLIKQLSQNFHEGERGVWSVEILEPGQEYVISYLIENNKDLNVLPTVYGVDKEDVFGILISAKEILFQLTEDRTIRIERVGLGIAVGLLLFYLFF